MPSESVFTRPNPINPVEHLGAEELARASALTAVARIVGGDDTHEDVLVSLAAYIMNGIDGFLTIRQATFMPSAVPGIPHVFDPGPAYGPTTYNTTGGAETAVVDRG